MGVASGTPWGKLSVEMDTTSPAFVVSNAGSTTPSLYIGGVNQNGFVGFGTTTISSLARISIGGSMSASGSQTAVTGVHSLYTFNPTGGGVQIGDRLVLTNSPTSATNTAVADLIRVVDDSGISNLVRGLDVNSAGGTNTYGVNTGIRGAGHTFGVQGITTGLASGSSTAAALYGESTGTTEGDILRLFTSTMTTATSVARFYHQGSTFSGTGLIMDFARGGGTFNGDFLNLRVDENSRFVVTAGGTTTIGELGQTATQAGLQIGYGGICVDLDGSCTASTSGRITAREVQTAGADIAESYYSSELLEAGDIVYTQGKYSVGKASSPSDAVIGVVSTKPGLTLGEGEVQYSSLNEYPVGLAGRIPVKLSTENGPISIGDEIALSSIPGIGMKYDPSKPGTIIGIALEPFDGTSYLSTGTVEVETQTVVTGTSCSWQPTTSDEAAGGGASLDGQPNLSSNNSSAQYVQVCEPVQTVVVPQSGSAISENTQNQIVQIGKALMFISVDRSRLTVSNGAVPPISGDLVLDGGSILNVGGISSASGKWSINADGNLVAETVLAKKGAFTESLEVGSQSTPSGVTIYDSVTGQPTCLQIANGIISVSPNACAPTISTSQNTNTSGGSSSGGTSGGSSTTSTTTATTTTTSTGSGSTGSTTNTTTSTTTPSSGSTAGTSTTTATTTTTSTSSVTTTTSTQSSQTTSSQNSTSSSPTVTTAPPSTSNQSTTPDPSTDPATSQTASNTSDPDPGTPSGA